MVSKIENGRGSEHKSVVVRWNDVMRRGADVVPHFADVRLQVTAGMVAVSMGLTGAGVLRKLLRERRLSPFREFRNWIYVLRLVEKNERHESIAPVR